MRCIARLTCSAQHTTKPTRILPSVTDAAAPHHHCLADTLLPLLLSKAQEFGSTLRTGDVAVSLGVLGFLAG